MQARWDSTWLFVRDPATTVLNKIGFRLDAATTAFNKVVMICDHGASTPTCCLAREPASTVTQLSSTDRKCIKYQMNVQQHREMRTAYEVLDSGARGLYW